MSLLATWRIFIVPCWGGSVKAGRGSFVRLGRRRGLWGRWNKKRGILTKAREGRKTGAVPSKVQEQSVMGRWRGEGGWGASLNQQLLRGGNCKAVAINGGKKVRKGLC